MYKNREVTVMGLARRVNPPSTIVVQYQDGSHETVSLSQVQFTNAEKTALVKANPSDYAGVNTISEDDLKAVRSGVSPSSDSDRKVKAETAANIAEVRKLDEANAKKAKDGINKAADGKTQK
jgi:hypothetical protein